MISGLSLGILLISGVAQTGAPPDSLWQKAVAIAQANDPWIPGLMVSRLEMLDGKGGAQSVEEFWVQFTLGADGKVQSKRVKHLKDGKEVSEPEPSEGRDEDGPQEKEKHSFSFSFTESPFHPKVQGKVAFQRTTQTKTIRGRPCAGYPFTLRKEKGAIERGTAWLEEGTGVPVELQFSPSPLPKRVQRLVTTVRYETTPEGAWHPVEIVFEGEGGFLFIKRRFRNVIRLSEYRRHPETTQK